MSKYPKIGIRPTIDGRQGGVRESLEEKTMNLAKAVFAFSYSPLSNIFLAWFSVCAEMLPIQQRARRQKIYFFVFRVFVVIMHK